MIKINDKYNVGTSVRESNDDLFDVNINWQGEIFSVRCSDDIYSEKQAFLLFKYRIYDKKLRYNRVLLKSILLRVLLIYVKKMHLMLERVSMPKLPVTYFDTLKKQDVKMIPWCLRLAEKRIEGKNNFFSFTDRLFIRLY